MAAWSRWPQELPLYRLLPLEIDAKASMDVYPQFSFFAPVFIQGKTIRGRICGAKGKGRVMPHASCHTLPLHILIPMPHCSITNYPKT